MSDTSRPPAAHDKPLFTPGPLTTSRGVKQAMLRDLGSRDAEFIAVVREIRDELLKLGGVSQADGFEAILLQGSGTFGIEAVLTSVVQKGGKLCVLINGAYGERMASIAERHGIAVAAVRAGEDETITAARTDLALRGDPAITHVAVVHCETTTGILNPVDEIGAVVARHGRSYIVDSMSAFGGIPCDVARMKADWLVSSANKCIEGVPGFSFVVCKKDALLATKGVARTVTLDLLAQWQGLEQNGQFRFTPPTHALLAFRQALRELDAEGGVSGRHARYQSNRTALLLGMRKLGFEEYLAEGLQGPIITSFRYPAHAAFRFEDFYARLSDRGFVIYPGKLSKVDCFRVGHIGRLFPSDVQQLVAAVAAVLDELGVPRGPT